jgi:hypothetical protein
MGNKDNENTSNENSGSTTKNNGASSVEPDFIVPESKLIIENFSLDVRRPQKDNSEKEK